MDELRGFLAGNRTGVLLGSSGVGKSTLVNRLVGTELMRTREIREDDGKGRHTTTHRELVLLPGGGMLIDTPGMRELQLWEAGDGLDAAFADVEELATGCRFSDCTHTREPGCAVLAAVDRGGLPLDRLRNYRQLQRELVHHAIRAGDRSTAAARRQEYRRFSRSLRKDAW
jgi:ribosome biogenesis GTPase